MEIFICLASFLLPSSSNVTPPFFIVNPFYVMLVGSALFYGTQEHTWIKEILATLTQTGNSQSR